MVLLAMDDWRRALLSVPSWIWTEQCWCRFEHVGAVVVAGLK